jgi:GT2 family glycosyltransferase
MTAREIGITVAVSTRDRPDALARCLASLGAGDRIPDEVVVVDQSDAANPPDAVAREHQPNLTIRYLRHDRRGLGAAQNVAFQQARHPIVAVLDDDCIAHASWLRTIGSVLRDRPDLAGVTGRVLPLDADGDRTFAVASRTSAVAREFVGQALPWEVGSGNNFALRRDVFLRIGGCDERLGPGSPAHGGVDMDLFHRLVRHGDRLRYEPDAVVYHERQTRAARSARRPMYGFGMGAAIAFWRNTGDPTAGIVLREWLALRVRQARNAAAARDWTEVGHEMTMLTSTARGLVHGWRRGRSVVRVETDRDDVAPNGTRADGHD